MDPYRDSPLTGRIEMTLRNSISLIGISLMIALAVGGCGRDTSTLPEAGASTNPIVFDDDFSQGLDYQAFQWSDVYALNMAFDVVYRGSSPVLSRQESGFRKVLHCSDGGFCFPLNPGIRHEIRSPAYHDAR